MAGKIEDYQVLGELARGSMGVVFRAHCPSLGQDVALKRMARPGSQEEIERFCNEVNAAVRVRHPNIVAVYDAGADAKGLWLAMELVEGETLLEWITRDGPLPVERAASVAADIALALDHAHELGVVHRDIKPDNILIDADGTPRLADFGLVRLVDRNTRFTREGDVVGTPLYMAPEQARGKLDIGPSVDVYGLGATLFHALTGRPPFLAEEVVEVLEQVAKQRPPRVTSVRPEVPNALASIVARCLEKRPRDRYETCADLACDLRTFLADPDAPLGVQPRRVGAPSAPILIAGGGILAAVLMVAFALVQFSGPEPRPTPSPVVVQEDPSSPPKEAPAQVVASPSPEPETVATDLEGTLADLRELNRELDPARALKGARAAVERWPSEPRVRLAHAHALASTGLWDQALEEYEGALRQDEALMPTDRAGLVALQLVGHYAGKHDDFPRAPLPEGWVTPFGGRWFTNQAGHVVGREGGLGTFQVSLLLAPDPVPEGAYRLRVEVDPHPDERQPSYAGIVFAAEARDDYFALFFVSNPGEGDEFLPRGLEAYRTEHGVEPVYLRMTRQRGSNWEFPGTRLVAPQRERWLQLTVEVRGRGLRAWVGGQLSMELELDRPLTGRVGLLKFYEHEIHYRGWSLEPLR